MAAFKRVREKLLEAGDWQKYPTWFKKVLARRLLLLLIPSELSRNLPRWLSAPIFGDGAVYPDGIPWPDWMVIPPDFEWPDWWTPWVFFDFAPGTTPKTAFPLDWLPGDPLPPGVTITQIYPFPPGWTPGDPLPPGVIVPPGVQFPEGWGAGDLVPAGVILPPAYALPPGWSPFNPPPPEVYITKPETWPPDWSPFRIPTYWIFPDPQIENPYPDTVAPATYEDPWEPGPIKPKTSGKLPSITIHLPETDWREVYRSVVGESWGTVHDSVEATQITKSDWTSWIGRAAASATSVYSIGRAIHKFAIPSIPAGAYYEAGVLNLYRYGSYINNIIAQATNITDITLLANYSKMTGEATLVTPWIDTMPVVILNADIVAYINANTGGNIYLMTREYDHDYDDTSPTPGQIFRGSYYTPGYGVNEPDLVLRYRG